MTACSGGCCTNRNRPALSRSPAPLRVWSPLAELLGLVHHQHPPPQVDGQSVDESDTTRLNSFALVLTVSAVERQRQNEGHVAYPSTQFLLAKRREREVPNDPRRQHTRVPAAGSAGDAAQWQRECDVSPVRRVSDGVLSVARSADALRARRAASETADRPAGAAPRAHRRQKRRTPATKLTGAWGSVPPPASQTQIES